jgi:hypothetical protein
MRRLNADEQMMISGANVKPENIEAELVFFGENAVYVDNSPGLNLFFSVPADQLLDNLDAPE